MSQTKNVKTVHVELSRIFSFLVCILSCFYTLSAQEKGTVSGTILDSDGQSIPGVTVFVNSGTNGTIADEAGRYALDNVAEGDSITFSILGYLPEIKIARFNGTASIIMNAILSVDAATLSEAQVVAFGTQKKESVIGAISSVSMKELKAPTSNLTTSLGGRIAGLISYQRSGEPGADDASFFIRGVTSFNNNTNPLILIDNVELSTTDLAKLQPDDIESFTIMKDATATALYGARGANGVILVKTKEGHQGKVKLSVRIENSFSQPTEEVELADPITYMKLHNEAILTRNPGALRLYSDHKINNTIPGSNSQIYPAVDWRDALLNDYTLNQRANISISGGTEKARYYVAGSFTNDNGIIKNNTSNNFNNNISNKNFTLRSNVNLYLTKTTELIVRLSGTFTDYSGPLSGGNNVYKMIMRSNPVLFPAVYNTEETKYLPYIAFGNYDDGSTSYYLNPYAETVKGYKQSGRSNMNAQLELKQDFDFLTKGLTARALLNVLRISSYSVSRTYKPAYYYMNEYDPFTGEFSIVPKDPEGTNFGILDYVSSPKSVTSKTYFEGSVNYNREFGKHSTSGLLVFQMTNTLSPNDNDILLSLPKRNLGLSGRFTYAYGNRYFAEFNFGYNGSERFAKKHRWGFFPSAGVAWLVSNEEFMKPVKHIFDNLKFRVSYGVVGNDNLTGNDLDRFFFMSKIDMSNTGNSFGFGSDPNNLYRLTGIDVLRYANEDIHWERSFKANYALEVGLFDSFSLVLEYYTERRSDIYQKRVNIPSTMGLEAPVYANIGEAKGKGIDATLNYNKAWNNGMWLQVQGNFTYATSWYSKYEERTYDEYWRTRIGYPINQQWGYIAEGLFIDQAEVDNTPHIPGAMAGDIKYKDVNDDGIIDGADKVPIGFPTVPEIVYGFGASYGYKGFDFSFFFQGSGRESFFIDYKDNNPFMDLGWDGKKTTTQLPQFIVDSHWSEDNQDTRALWPRLSTTSIDNNAALSTWWMRDASYIRLKQVEFGYTLPKKISKKIGMDILRIYLSGSNLLCFSQFKEWDPGLGSNSMNYPLQRVYNLGINLTF